MTTSSRMEHHHSIRPTYPHQHPIQESFHLHHPFSTGSTDISREPIPPLAYLSEAAAAMSSSTVHKDRRTDYQGETENVAAEKGNIGRYQNYSTHSTQQKGRHSQGNTNTVPGECSQGGSSLPSGRSSPHEDTDMSTATATATAVSVHEGPDREHSDNNVNSSSSRRASVSMSMSMALDSSSATLTPTPSPHARSSVDYPPEHHHPRYTNGNHPGPYSQHHHDHHHLASPDQHYNHHHPKHPHHPAHQSSQTTPSPPLPTPDGFQGRPLPPIEPSHPLHSYMSNSRRGSLADPEYHSMALGGGANPHRRPSATTIDASNGYNNGTAPGGGPETRHYATTPPPPPSAEPHYSPYPHPSTSPMQLRQSEQHSLGRRESLPSIHSSAGPLGQLLAQEPQRRHSIAHGDHMGPVKRKTSSTPLSQVHSVDMDHPAKRRDSIPDAAHPYSHHPYARSSLSAPSSPPRRGSIASHGHVPTLNLQPAAEIKLQNGPSMTDHGRPLFPLHQPRRPSLLSEASLSRRSSVADAHHYPSHFQQQQQHHGSQDYDHNMNADMERMHLSGHGSDSQQSYSGGGGAPPAPGQGHLYPGYPPEGGAKGDTPYSRSPELRVSHKLAERKRRKEMKELFDELRDSLPVDRSLKTSKWEILSKAVDYISSMKANQDDLTKEIDMLRQEVARLRKH